jgi:hypothetical protein
MNLELSNRIVRTDEPLLNRGLELLTMLKEDLDHIGAENLHQLQRARYVAQMKRSAIRESVPPLKHFPRIPLRCMRATCCAFHGPSSVCSGKGA